MSIICVNAIDTQPIQMVIKIKYKSKLNLNKNIKLLFGKKRRSANFFHLDYKENLYK